MIRVGVTGTRQGATEPQLATVGQILAEVSDYQRELHHGGCIGVDEQVAILAMNDGYATVEHPPLNPEFASRRINSYTILPPKNYLVRNRAIVHAVDRMLVVPRRRGTIGGGTGYTFRYARDLGVPALIVWPDGEMTLYDGRNQT